MSQLALWLGLVSAGYSIRAEEPHQRFIKQLREERLFDLALVYLDDIQKRPSLDAEFRKVVDLERALLFLNAASQLSPKTPQRGEKLEKSEAFLRKFINESAGNPRRSEARMKLGALLQLRAEEALLLAGTNTNSGVPEAIKFYDAAHQLYEESIKELAEIENSLKGARVDPQDREKVAYRSQVRLELRESQLYSAKAVEDRGKSRAANDPLREQDLKTALNMYNELYRKETTLTGIRTFALLYRAGIQAQLNDKDNAIDGYQRIVDLENADQLRPVQTQALTELIQVLASQDKYQPAVERAEAWITKLQPDEKTAPEVMALKLAYSRIRIEWLKKLRSDKSDDRLAARIDKAVRADLRMIIRVVGPHVDEAKSLLATLGVDSSKSALSTELPNVKNLSEALEEATKRMEESDSEALEVSMLEEKLAAAELPAEEKSSLITDRDAKQEQIDQLRQSALEVLRLGLTKYDSTKDDRTQLFNARFRMAYLLLQSKQTREAIVIGEFLSRTSPGTQQGQNAAAVVLQGFSELLQQPNVDQAGVMSELTPFAEYLVATWPQSAQAAAASGALTQLAVLAKNYDQAEKYLQVVPVGSPGVGRQYFDLGAAFFDEYQKLKNEANSDAQLAKSFRERSERWLQLAVDHVAIEDSAIAVSASNILAQLKLENDDLDTAAKLMIGGDKAPMKWLDTKLDKVTPTAALQAYRTALRITAAQLAAGKVDSESAQKSMQDYVNRLQQIGGQTAEGRQKLQASYAAIAADLKEKLALIQDPAKRAELAQVVLLVIDEVSKSESYDTQAWAATTLVSVAQGLEQSGKASPASQQAFAKAAELLQSMLERNKQEPGWIPEKSLNLLRIQQARASDGIKEYSRALAAFAEVLDQNEGLLDVQIDVARVLQRAAANNAALYKSAINGARPNPKTKRNVFWGWGRIGQETANKKEFSNEFFEARYQLANCRMLYALSLNEAAAKNKELSGAERAIIETHTLYPSLGGPTEFKRYDELLKKIQAELGQPQTGLSEKKNG
jgi:hypothetical protein